MAFNENRSLFFSRLPLGKSQLWKFRNGSKCCVDAGDTDDDRNVLGIVLNIYRLDGFPFQWVGNQVEKMPSGEWKFPVKNDLVAFISSPPPALNLFL